MEETNPSFWKKLLPLLAKCTGSAGVILVAVAAAGDLVLQSGSHGAFPALLAMLGSLYGDVVAGPLVARLLAAEDDEFENLVREFEIHLHQEDIRRDVATLLQQQNVFMNVIGTALQYHEQQIVRRILSGVAQYQESIAEYILAQLTSNYKESLDPETRYLTNLIYKLSGHEGTLEYVGLRGEAIEIAFATPNRGQRRKLIDPAFSILGKISTLAGSINDKNVKKTPLTNIREAIEKYPRFVLIGSPGAGKTTTLRRLALDAAWARMEDPQEPIPFYLELSRWQDNKTFEQFIEHWWTLDLDLHVALRQGDVRLYLDGLNEMGAERERKAAILRKWQHDLNYPQYTIITCRDSDYPELDLGITAIAVEPLNADQVRRFVTNYLDDELATNFLRHVIPNLREETSSFHLFSLANNPFMLRGLMLVYEYSPEGDLPTNMASVFKTLIRFLWQREKERNTHGWMPEDFMIRVLSKLAFDMIEKAQATSVPLSDLYQRRITNEFFRAAQSARACLQSPHSDLQYPAWDAVI